MKNKDNGIEEINGIGLILLFFAWLFGNVFMCDIGPGKFCYNPYTFWCGMFAIGAVMFLKENR